MRRTSSSMVSRCLSCNQGPVLTEYIVSIASNIEPNAHILTLLLFLCWISRVLRIKLWDIYLEQTLFLT